MSFNKTVLDEISVAVRTRLVERQRAISLATLVKNAKAARAPHDFVAGLKGGQPSIIAEIKFVSPSQGLLNKSLSAVEVAHRYLNNGATALSILTEQDFFGGTLDHLKSVRREFSEAFLLMKDFIIDEYQIYEALCGGADCILLIVALLGAKKVQKFLTLARALKITALVEVHDEDELQIAVAVGANLIGVNNRDLKTLTTSLEVSRRLIKLVPAECHLVCESGINNLQQINELQKLGFNSFLVGTALMRETDPGLALKNLVGARHA